MSSPFFEPLTPEQTADYTRREAADLADARDRFRLALVDAGVPVEEAANVLAGLEDQGFKPRLRSDYGVLSEGMLFGEPGNPNAGRHESLVLSQEWQRLDPFPDPPWVFCAWDEEYNVVPRLEACTDPEHAEHRRTTFNGSMHRASPDEVAQLRAQETDRG